MINIRLPCIFMKSKSSLITLFLVPLIVFLIPINVLGFSGESVPFNPATVVSFLEDPKAELTYEDIQKKSIQSQFKPAQISGDEINFAYSNSVYWLKLSLSKQANLPQFSVIELPYFGLNRINFYAPGQPAVKTGSAEPIQSRPFFYRFYAFPITLSDVEQDFYLKVQSDQPISVPLKVWGREDFVEHIQVDTFFQALYYGGIGVLALFNLFLFVYLRDKAYLFYAGFAGFIGIGILSGNGYGRLFLWPNFPVWDDVSQAVLLGLASANAMMFISEFLKVKTFSVILNRVLVTLAIALALNSAGLWFASALHFSVGIFFILLPLLSIPSAILTIYIGFRALLAGYKSAQFFLFAWGVLAIGAIVGSLRMFNVLPSNAITSYALQISSAIEMLLLAFALASRIKEERELRESAQNEAFNSQQDLVESLRASEEHLENQVSMRTNDLKLMLENEKSLREQYVRFGSLISHEFRNPLGIIEGQTALLCRDGISETSMKRVSIISSATHRLASLFDRWLQGDRLQSGIDQVRPQIIHLNQWITELIEGCKNYHANHAINFVNDLSETVLIADEKMLEVVVLNLIDNACKFSNSGLSVTVSVLHINSMIGISIKDQGIGIDEKDHLVIFNEYHQISSKKSTKGFGLGLAFVKKVLEFHGGRIELFSQIDQGSEFIAWFPDQAIVLAD
jgi:signal transduction histidine kinase